MKCDLKNGKKFLREDYQKMKPLLIQYGLLDKEQVDSKLAAMNETTNEFAIRRGSKVSEYI